LAVVDFSVHLTGCNADISIVIMYKNYWENTVCSICIIVIVYIKHFVWNCTHVETGKQWEEEDEGFC